jgi:chromosome segregation ATPase
MDMDSAKLNLGAPQQAKPSSKPPTKIENIVPGTPSVSLTSMIDKTGKAGLGMGSRVTEHETIIADKDKTIATFADKLKNAGLEIDKYQKHVDALLKIAHGLKKDKSELEGKATKLSEDLLAKTTELTTQIRERKEEKERLEKQVKEKEGDIKEKEGSIKELGSQIEEKTKEINRLTTTLKETTESKGKEIDKLKQQIQEKQKEIDNKCMEEEDLKGELARSKELMKELDKKLDVILEQLKTPLSTGDPIPPIPDIKVLDSETETRVNSLIKEFQTKKS